MRILITGATGNVGLSILRYITNKSNDLIISAGVRDIDIDKDKLSEFNVALITFDFENDQTFKKALLGIEVLFLLRPPQLANVSKFFKPLIDEAIKAKVKHIVFLSVQGVENSKIIPHHKIEKLIVDSKLNYTFLRPAYFMQNFTTTLRKDLVEKKRIYLPAGNAKFTLIDIRDIGAVSAGILTNISQHINKSYELTCKEKLTFKEMAKTLSSSLGIEIQFKSPSLISFFLTKRKEKIPTMLILVMIMLHYFPRFQKEPKTTDWVENIIGRPPTTFKQFVTDHKQLLTE